MSVDEKEKPRDLKDSKVPSSILPSLLIVERNVRQYSFREFSFPRSSTIFFDSKSKFVRSSSCFFSVVASSCSSCLNLLFASNDSLCRESFEIETADKIAIMS